MKKIFFILVLILLLVSGYVIMKKSLPVPLPIFQTDNRDPIDESVQSLDPLSIELLRKGTYPGSDLVIEQTLGDGSNYHQYLVSYFSEGNKIYALLTVPVGETPANGWPAIVFNHGYIAPEVYRTTERYEAYVSGFARAEYIVLKPDYRGHGESGGEPSGAYGSNGYTVDVLNALASLKKYPDVDKNNIGMWGHSMGGFITLRAMVTIPDIKAGVIWGGVVGSYEDLLNNWRRGPTPAVGAPTATPFPLPSGARRWRQALVEQYGTPEKNPVFWNSISATGYLKDISGPLSLHHGEQDESVPPLFSRKLESRMKAAGKVVKYFEYQGNDHNISQSFNLAMSRSVAFFDTYLKK